MHDDQPASGEPNTEAAPAAPAPITCSGGIRLPMPSPELPKE